MEISEDTQELQPKVPPPDLFVGDLEFGITIEAISAHAAEIKEELAQINAAFDSGNMSEDLRKFALGRKNDIENFLVASDEEILRACREIYDFVQQAEKEGLKKQDILRKMMSVKPELRAVIGRFYDILRTQIWGYRLFQDLCTFRG